MHSNVSKEVMIGCGLFYGTFKAIWLHSVELCLPRVRESGKNMGKKTVVKNSKMVGQYSYEQDEGVRKERRKPLHNLQNSNCTGLVKIMLTLMDYFSIPREM